MIVPNGVDSPAHLYLNYGYMPSGFDVTYPLKIGDYLRADLVTTRGHHPFFKIRPSRSKNRSIVINAEQYSAPLKVRKSDEFARKVVILNHVALKLDARVFAVVYDFEK